jgi:hypothetical protein
MNKIDRIKTQLSLNVMLNRDKDYITAYSEFIDYFRTLVDSPRYGTKDPSQARVMHECFLHYRSLWK